VLVGNRPPATTFWPLKCHLLQGAILQLGIDCGLKHDQPLMRRCCILRATCVRSKLPHIENLQRAWNLTSPPPINQAEDVSNFCIDICSSFVRLDDDLCRPAKNRSSRAVLMPPDWQPPLPTFCQFVSISIRFSPFKNCQTCDYCHLFDSNAS
jgi:hypothetical protein